MGCNNRIFSKNNVVRDLHEVVDLHAFLDPRPAKSSAINRRVRADLCVVVDLDDADLRNFSISTIDKFESESICADDCAAVNNYARADLGPFANGHVWINQA